MQRLKISRRQRFDECEHKELGRLPVDPYEFREFDYPRVQVNYHVCLRADRHYYSVPHTYRHKVAKVAYSARTVEIYHNNERIAVHRRDRRSNGHTTTVHHIWTGASGS